jgi:hypothetical protein
MKFGMKQHVGETTELHQACKALHQVDHRDFVQVNVCCNMLVHPQKVLKILNFIIVFIWTFSCIRCLDFLFHVAHPSSAREMCRLNQLHSLHSSPCIISYSELGHDSAVTCGYLWGVHIKHDEKQVNAERHVCLHIFIIIVNTNCLKMATCYSWNMSQ